MGLYYTTPRAPHFILLQYLENFNLFSDKYVYQPSDLYRWKPRKTHDIRPVKKYACKRSSKENSG